MKKNLTLIAALVVLMTMTVSTLPVWAAEEAAPPKAEGSKDAAKGGEEGAAKPKAPEGVSGGRFAGDPVYVHLNPMVLPVISDAGVEQLITVVIDIEVTDFDVADKIHSHMPQVMDSLMTSLYGGLGQGSLRHGKLVDVSKIKAKATTAMESVVGPDAIKNVLVQSVSQRML
jgi:flagellar basal body-associated protein FliL